MNNLPVITDSGWGAAEGLENTDLQVPKIWHMQAMSQYVADGLARPGDWVDSLTGEVLGKKEDALELIIFGSTKQMLISKMNAQNKWELEKVVQITKENAAEYASVPFMEEHGGQKYKNSLQYSYLCLMVGKLTELPFVLSFASTKLRAARKLNTMLYKLEALKKPSASFVFECRAKQESNDRGTWFGVDIAQGRATEPAELQVAYEWYARSKSQHIVAAESHDADHSDVNI